MSSGKELKKAEQLYNRAALKLSRERERIRKNDIHNKIQLGGLVIKSGMDKYSKSVILGALIDAVNNIKNDPDYERIYKMKGDRAFDISDS